MNSNHQKRIQFLLEKAQRIHDLTENDEVLSEIDEIIIQEINSIQDDFDIDILQKEQILDFYWIGIVKKETFILRIDDRINIIKDPCDIIDKIF